VRRYWPLALLLAASACQSRTDPRQTNFIVDRPGVKAQYDSKSGHLKRLEVDTNKNGRIDTWSYMDGARFDLIEIDRDENGKIDRWEHYAEGKLASVGTSTRGDGVEDEWAYPGAGGYVERIETDTDRNGKIDKWQAYDKPLIPGGAPVLRSVSTEPDASGRPTLRLYYRADGSFERTEHLNPSGK